MIELDNWHEPSLPDWQGGRFYVLLLYFIMKMSP